MEDGKPLCCICVGRGRKEEKRSLAPVHFHLPLPFILLTLLSACLLSICFLSVSPPLLSLLSSPPPLSLFLSVSPSWCKVMKADVCGSGRARLRDYTASRMKDSWCSQGFVRLCMCVFGEGTGKREQGETEGKKEGAWGDKDIQCQTNWWSAAGLTLRPAIILTAALHIFRCHQFIYLL